MTKKKDKKQNKMPDERDFMEEVNKVADSMNVNIPSEEEISTKEIDAFSLDMAKMHSKLDLAMNGIINSSIQHFTKDDRLGIGHVLHGFLVAICIQIFMRATDDEHAVELIDNVFADGGFDRIADIARELEKHTVGYDQEEYEKKIFDEDAELEGATIH